MMSDKPEQARSAKPAGATNILVVDDSKDIRDLLHTILQHHGYEVLLAADGESALQAYHQHRGVIHLVIIDIVMPGMSGLKLAAKFAALRPDIKVLFVSAFVQETVLQGKLRPVDRFLAKPIPPERLITKVQEVLAA
jgi:CheY-like chemotaxis protein